MKYCIFCGQQIPDVSNFCGVCGAAQNVEEKTNPPVPPANMPNQSVNIPVSPVYYYPPASPQAPTVRQKLLPYTIFTLVAQLVIIVFMCCDFGIIRVNNSVHGSWGLIVLLEGEYGISIFNYSNKLRMIAPGKDNIELPGEIYFILIFMLIISILFYLCFIIGNLTKPTKFSSVCLVIPVIFLLFSNLFLFSAVNKISSVLSLKSEELFSISISWESIVIILLVVAQFAANVAVRNIKIQMKRIGIFAGINKNKRKIIEITIALSAVILLLIIPGILCRSIIIVILGVILGAAFIGSYFFDFSKGKKH